MTDLYEKLGVPPDATEKEIKKSFRKKAVKAHPDKGGSDEEMAELSNAYAVLVDPERREKYDNGEDTDLPRSEKAQAIEMMCVMFEEAINESKSYKTTDLIEKVKEKTEIRDRGLVEAIEGAKYQMKMHKDIQKRLKGDGALRHHLVQAARTTAKALPEIEFQREVLVELRELIKEYEYDNDEPDES